MDVSIIALTNVCVTTHCSKIIENCHLFPTTYISFDFSENDVESSVLSEGDGGHSGQAIAKHPI